ncbi:hypothetical protein CVS47_01217 [Microbacterium lemovicicum]|uniref:DUF2076 domain-containing protein n=1 Tax=Microbacterium lemovicicum TaxID=1072463 RepID=A0A3Q9IXL3_9MICO|nr:hypothetical protein [Microbacterium lemovicicum]AZS36610.1 hypothetical protein CVS47_01217 [Microbacterium lemovicicum]
MGFWDRLMGNDDTARPAPQPGRGAAPGEGAQSEDERAIERYRYLLRTAPPETIEQVHAEAFAQLTEPQRQQVLAELSAGLDPAEQPRSTDPQAMARAATRAEYRSPGFMERTLGGGAGGQRGPGMGAMIGSSLLGTVAGYVIGSALVSAFMAPAFADGGYGDGGSGDGGSGDGGSGDGGSADAAGADSGAVDGSFGGDVGGGFGGDFGGGDFGGGDFGGF